MRVAAVSQMKGVTSGIALMRERPAAGTKIGTCFDKLMARKGSPVEISSVDLGQVMAVLVDIYGLDIRLVRRMNKRKGRLSAQYVLAGEWFGKVYVDYIAEHLASLKDREVA